MIAAALAAAALALAPAPAQPQTLHLLVIRLAPVDVAWLQQQVAATDAYYDRASFGKVRVTADFTPVVEGFVPPAECFERPPGVDRGLGAFATAAKRAANAPEGYDRYVYLTAQPVCGAAGLGVGDDILLSENFGLVHELGHTLGLPHAGSARCPTCAVSVYGDMFSPMGHGGPDFSVWEKVKLGWVEEPPRVTRAGRYTIAPASALVARSRVGDLWIEVIGDWVVIRGIRNDRTVQLAALHRAAVVPHLVRVKLVGPRRVELAWLRR